jgi:2-methylcitrate dehydratase PrpD
MTALDDLSAFVVAPPPAYAAPGPRERARMALVDLVGVTLAGTREPVADLLAAHHAATGESGPCGLIGLSGSATACSAAFINAAIGHALDFDDSNFVLGGHPSVVIYPGLIALAQARGASGRAVLDAYVAGFEVMSRIAAAVNLHHYEKGWHPTATLGVFGAAAAAARLLGLPQQQTVATLALAAASASGIKESFGSMAKPVQVGQAASRGVLAALLAERGVTAPATALDGPRGFFAVYNGAGNFDVSRLAVDPDEPELMRSGIKFKRYACCGSTHVAIDAALALRSQPGFDAGSILAVQLDVNPRRRPHVDRPQITEPLGAKFSLQYTVAAALLDGAVGLDHFSPASVRRPDLAALMRRVTVGDLSDQPDLSQHCALSVTLAGKRTLSVRLDGPQGRDVADYAVYMKQKFNDCAGQALPGERVALLDQYLDDFAGLESVTPLVRASLPAPASRNPRNGTHD